MSHALAGSDLTYPLAPNEEQRAGRFGTRVHDRRVPAPTGEGRAQKRRPGRSTNYLFGRGGSFVTGRAMLR